MSDEASRVDLLRERLRSLGVNVDGATALWGERFGDSAKGETVRSGRFSLEWYVLDVSENTDISLIFHITADEPPLFGVYYDTVAKGWFVMATHEDERFSGVVEYLHPTFSALWNSAESNNSMDDESAERWIASMVEIFLKG